MARFAACHENIFLQLNQTDSLLFFFLLLTQEMNKLTIADTKIEIRKGKLYSFLQEFHASGTFIFQTSVKSSARSCFFHVVKEPAVNFSNFSVIYFRQLLPEEKGSINFVAAVKFTRKVTI